MCPSCATTLSNSEVNEGYKDRQDPAITIKFPLYQTDEDLEKIFGKKIDCEKSEDGLLQVVCCAIKKDNKFLMIYHKR